MTDSGNYVLFDDFTKASNISADDIQTLWDGEMLDGFTNENGAMHTQLDKLSR